MSDQVKNRIAKTLEIDPDQIMDYRKVEDGTYTVINFNFQKFKGVVPAEPEPKPEPPAKKTTTRKRTAKKKAS